MQPAAALRPFGRSGQELPVEYQVEPHFINFSVSTAKKGYRQGPGSGNLEEPLQRHMWSKQRFHSDSTSTKIIPKSNRKKTFLCVYLLVLRPELNSSQDSRKVSQGIFQKNQNWRSYRGGKIYTLWIVTTILSGYTTRYSTVHTHIHTRPTSTYMLLSLLYSI